MGGSENVLVNDHSRDSRSSHFRRQTAINAGDGGGEGEEEEEEEEEPEFQVTYL